MALYYYTTEQTTELTANGRWVGWVAMSTRNARKGHPGAIAGHAADCRTLRRCGGH